MEPETGRAAVVSICIIDGQQDEHGQITAGGNAATWTVPEGQIDWLKDQMHRLFGAPVIEHLLPAIAQELIDGMGDQWPGVVKLTRDDT